MEHINLIFASKEIMSIRSRATYKNAIKCLHRTATKTFSGVKRSFCVACIDAMRVSVSPYVDDGSGPCMAAHISIYKS